MTFEQYLKVDAISSSDMKKILQSPAKYKQYKNTSSKSTDAMLLGSAIHCRILEPEEFTKRYIFEPNLDKVKNKAKWKEFKQDCIESNRIILKNSYNDIIEGIVQNLNGNMTMQAILNNPSIVFEQSLFWHDKQFDIDCKCQCDFIIFNGDMAVIGDIKTTTDCDNPFERDFEKYQYYLQAYHYCCGVKASYENIKSVDFLFVAIEKTAPFEIQCYDLEKEYYEIGKIEREKAINKYKECLKNDSWKRSENIKTLKVSNWLKNKNLSKPKIS